MLQSSNKNAVECYRRAVECRRRAGDATSVAARADFLDLEQRWVSLAQSYEFAERLGRFTGELDRQRVDHRPR